jgi:uncharacterized protein YqjF (DUF2071 family)
VASRQPEDGIRWPVGRQEWRDVLFLHWSYPAEAVARHLPRGFEPDTFGGQAFVALTPFQIGACGAGPLPPPRVWAFPETNLRTYVVGPDGRDGLWFLSIDAGSIPVTVAARVGLGAPYHWAEMTVRRDGRSIRYRSRRRGSRQARHDIGVTVGGPVAEADRAGLVDWCTGRWRSWTTHAGIAISSPVTHQPWPLHHAELVDLDETIFSAAGLDPPTGDPLVHFSPGVDARFGVSHPHRHRFSFNLASSGDREVLGVEVGEPFAPVAGPALLPAR